MADKFCDPSYTGHLGGGSFAYRDYALDNISYSSGDTIRMAKSPDPVLMDQMATWTNGSLTVTLSSTACLNLYLDGAWTAATNVTCTADSTNKKEGTNCASQAFAAGFTTGKAAYYATGTLDLRNYQTISYWVRSSTNVAGGLANGLYLCSDTTGDTKFDSGATARSLIYVPLVANTYTVQVAESDAGSIPTRWLPNGVQSIALYMGADPGTATYLIDNIIISGAASATDSLHLGNLISTSASGPWYPIKSINGTTITLDNHTNSLQGAGRGYWGPTGTYPLYKRSWFTWKIGVDYMTVFGYNSYNTAATYPSAATTVLLNPTNSGNTVTISGGWDPATSMTVQNGESWIMLNGAGNLFGALNNMTNASFEKINVWRGNTFATFNAANDDVTLTNCSAIGMTASPAMAPISGMDRTSFINCYTGNNQTIGFGTAANATNQGLIVRGLRSYNNGGLGFSSPIGTAFALGYAEVSDVEVANNGGAQGFLLQNPCKLINNIRAYDNAATSTNAGIQLTGQNVYAFNLTSSGHSTTGAGGILCNSNNPRLYNVITRSNANGILAGSAGLFIDSKINVTNWTSTSDTNRIGFPASNANQGWINSMSQDGVSTDNRSTSTYGVVSTDTSVTHSGTYSWKLAPGSTTQATQYAPLDHVIGRIPCNANKTINIKYWGRYSHATNIPTQLRIIGGVVPGVGSVGTDITVAFSGSANTWAQYTLTCTPTIDCVLEVLMESYISSGSGHVAYVDGNVEVT